jgi:hypothetical protein
LKGLGRSAEWNAGLSKVLTFLIVTPITWLLGSVKSMEPSNPLPVGCDCAEVGSTVDF